MHGISFIRKLVSGSAAPGMLRGTNPGGGDEHTAITRSDVGRSGVPVTHRANVHIHHVPFVHMQPLCPATLCLPSRTPFKAHPVQKTAEGMGALPSSKTRPPALPRDGTERAPGRH